MKPLNGKVALVAGATRGAGRGIAIELGAAGATVYVTGRTTRTQQSEYKRPETIEETAELVNDAGGLGIAVQVDHLDPDQVQALIARIENEQGQVYGFYDLDGSQPDCWRYLVEVQDAGKPANAAGYR